MLNLVIRSGQHYSDLPDVDCKHFLSNPQATYKESVECVVRHRMLTRVGGVRKPILCPDQSWHEAGQKNGSATEMVYQNFETPA